MSLELILNACKHFVETVKFGYRRRSTKILFYYPQHFNRNNSTNNAYFTRMFEVCLKHDINFIKIEEPSYNNCPRNEEAFKFDTILLLILILRKLTPQFFFRNFELREHFIGRCIRICILPRLKFKYFITISNSMVGIFKGLNSSAKLFDYQHGLIFSNHTGYFCNERVANHILYNEVSLLLYGKGFYKLLLTPKEDYYLNNSYIIGCSNQLMFKHYNVFNSNILVSLQFTGRPLDNFQKFNLEYLDSFFSRYHKFILQNELMFFLKHHPRYDFSLDLNALEKYTYVHFTNNNLEDCLKLCSAHLTYHSTTTFEAAQQGIPTYIINDTLSNKIFIDEFKYPIENNLSLCDWLSSLKDPLVYHNYQEKVTQWYNQFYEPFNEEEFLKIFGCEEN